MDRDLIAPYGQQCKEPKWVAGALWHCQLKVGHGNYHAAEPGPGETVTWPASPAPLGPIAKETTMENVRLPRPAKVRIERAHKSPTARVYINDVDVSNHVSAVTWGMKAGKLPTATLTFLDVEVDVQAEESGPGSVNIAVQSVAPNEGLRALAETNERECARIAAEVQDGGLPDFTAEDWEKLRRFAPGLVNAILGTQPVERRERVVPVPEPAELRTPEEWCERYGVDIADPDGWRHADAPAWTEPITLADFYDRARRCTVRNCATVDWQRIARDAKKTRNV